MSNSLFKIKVLTKNCKIVALSNRDPQCLVGSIHWVSDSSPLLSELTSLSSYFFDAQQLGTHKTFKKQEWWFVGACCPVRDPSTRSKIE